MLLLIVGRLSLYDLYNLYISSNRFVYHPNMEEQNCLYVSANCWKNASRLLVQMADEFIHTDLLTLWTVQGLLNIGEVAAGGRPSPAITSCFPMHLENVLKTIFNLPGCLHDAFVFVKTCRRRPQEDVLQTHLEDILKTSWRTKRCYSEDIFKISSRGPQHFFDTSSQRQMFAGSLDQEC